MIKKVFCGFEAVFGSFLFNINVSLFLIILTRVKVLVIKVNEFIFKRQQFKRGNSW